MQTKQDTICAISTPAGTGGIAVIRISGSNAFEICDKIFLSPGGKKLSETEANKVLFGTIVNNQSSAVNVIDEVLATVFRAPHSFTGEDTVEISCHGSLFIQQKILQLLLENGCRLAAAGEFTQRAFLNGKMDLSQAEAVADLIASTSAAAHAMAVSQMRGGFSDELQKLRGQLLDFVSLVELELDFSEEEVEFADRQKLRELSDEMAEKIARLADSFSVGNALKNGIPVAIVGETNVGKSTLLNALLNEEKAIVSDIHGTTRDVIEDSITLGGISFRFIDTAGIRQTTDTIETLGIERTFQKIRQASIVVLLLDATRPETFSGIEKIQAQLSTEQRLIVAVNKADSENSTVNYPLSAVGYIKISAKEKNIEALTDLLLASAQLPEAGQADVIVSNARHYEALTRARASLARVREGLQQGISGDFLAQDIRETMHHLSEITGAEISSDEILGNIFSRFCIGK